MPSFFFHLTNGDTFPDDRATPCGTLDEAKTVALAIAADWAATGRRMKSHI
jgi:hypothetical protein